MAEDCWNEIGMALLSGVYRRSVQEFTARQCTSRMFSSLTHRLMRIPAIVFVMAGGGCGSPVPDESASLQPPPMVNASHAEKASASHSLPVGEMTTHQKMIERDTSGAAAVNQSEDRDPASVPIPYSVADDLASPEPETRFQALEHWEQKDSKLPLDAVFEAMEDEDESVRAKATDIVEKRWVEEKDNDEG